MIRCLLSEPGGVRGPELRRVLVGDRLVSVADSLVAETAFEFEVDLEVPVQAIERASVDSPGAGHDLCEECGLGWNHDLFVRY